MDQFEKDFREFVESKSGKFSLIYFYACVTLKFPEHIEFLNWFKLLTEVQGKSIVMRDSLILPLFEHYYPLWQELKPINL